MESNEAALAPPSEVRATPTACARDLPAADADGRVVEYDPTAWPRKVRRESMLVPTVCFNCESACGLLAYVDTETFEIRKLEGNPDHPGSRGRNCAKGPATLNQITDPERILYPAAPQGRRAAAASGNGSAGTTCWTRSPSGCTTRSPPGRNNDVCYFVGRPGEDGFADRFLETWGCDGHNSHTNVCSSGGRTGYGFWSGTDRPVAGLRERSLHAADLRASGVGPLLQPARAADRRGAAARRRRSR